MHKTKQINRTTQSYNADLGTNGDSFMWLYVQAMACERVEIYGKCGLVEPREGLASRFLQVPQEPESHGILNV